MLLEGDCWSGLLPSLQSTGQGHYDRPVRQLGFQHGQNGGTSGAAEEQTPGAAEFWLVERVRKANTDVFFGRSISCVYC